MATFHFHPFPLLETERLRLRELTDRDEALIYNYHSNRENFPYVDMLEHKTIEDSREYIKKMKAGVKDNKWIIWAIADPLTDDIIGTISLWNLSTTDCRKGELGYGIFPEHRGKGLMAEALKEVIEYGFHSMKLEIIGAYTNINNHKSLALLEGEGFRKVTTVSEKGPSGREMILGVYEKRHAESAQRT